MDDETNEPPHDERFFDEIDREVMFRHHAEVLMLEMARMKALLKQALKTMGC